MSFFFVEREQEWLTIIVASTVNLCQTLESDCKSFLMGGNVMILKSIQKREVNEADDLNMTFCEDV